MINTLHNYYNYFYNFYFGNNVKNNIVNDDFVKVGFVSINDLKSVNLNPVKDIVPNPSRNAPPFFEKVDLRNLNKAQLNCILNVKLKPIPQLEKVKVYEVRHPCLRELLSKRVMVI
jgi:hypothetical protein